MPRDTQFHIEKGDGLQAVAEFLDNLGILARYALGLDYVGRDCQSDAVAVRPGRGATPTLDRP